MNSLDRAQLCEYVADISLELSQLARAADLRFLSYLLEMVFEESFTMSQKLRE